MRRLISRFDHERRRRGQAVPLLALCLLLLLAFSGLAIDGALAFAWRRNTSNAADGAALIGARALLDVRQNREDGGEIYEPIEAYLRSELDAADPVFTIHYVSGTGARLRQIEQDDDDDPPDAARGVAVDVRYTFNTYLMRVMGQETVTVGATAIARVGQLGAATGPEVVPLGIDQTAANIIRTNRGQDVVIDLYGEMEDQNLEWEQARLAGQSAPPPEENLDYDISADQLRSVNLIQGDTSPPRLGGGSNCNASAGTNTLRYWWCNGSDDPLRAVVPGVEPPQGTTEVERSIHGMVEARTRRSNRSQIVLVPVMQSFFRNGGWEYYVDYFMAIQLVDYNPRMTRGTYGALVVRYVGNYAAAGGIVGFTSGEVRGDPSWWLCDACAVNLVRER